MQMNGLVFAAIAPHGGIAIEEACPPEEREVAAATRAGFEELARRLLAARPDVVLVLTPHNVHIEGHMAIIDTGTMAGALPGAAHPVSLRGPVDRVFGYAVHEAFVAAGIPVVQVSYGGNDPATATMPMDWATLVPYWFLGGRTSPPLPLVAMTPARDLSPDMHVLAGETIARMARDSGKRVALIASADHAHAHDPNGPYGFSPSAARYDEAVLRVVREDNVAAFRDIAPALVAEAKADSWWQLLILSGALSQAAWTGELLSYEAPTYFGMACVAYAPTMVLADE